MKTIKEVSNETGLSPHTIRFYEKEGLINIPRNKQGIRIFNEITMDTLMAIAHYRNVGMSLQDIKQIMKEFHNHQLSTQLLNNTLTKLDTQINELISTREYLVKKIQIHQHLAELQKNGYTEKARYEAYVALRKMKKETINICQK